VSATEFSFLALGLVLGTAVGAALIVVFRARPAPRREVRLTVSPNSIPPRRPSTLASADPAVTYVPAPGGPAGDLDPFLPRESHPVMAPVIARATPVDAANRTAVPSAPARPVAPPPLADRTGSAQAAGPAVATMVLEAAPVPEIVPPPWASPVTADVGAPAQERAARVRPPARSLPAVVLTAAAVAVPIRPEARAGGDDGAVSTSVRAPSDAGPCALERRVAVERCEVADRARTQAAAGAEALARARRTYDALRQRVDEGERLADPRELRASKDAAHRTFRDARATARTAEEAEAAARDWLAEINRLNTASRTAAASLEADRDELRRSLPALERLSVEADAARIMSETADAGCLEAREALAVCEEAASAPPPSAPMPTQGPADGWPVPPADEPAATEGASPGHGGGVPRVLRLLRGDREARETLVAGLAGTDPEEVRRWRLVLADFVDAIVARAIEDGYLEVNADHGFWSMFDAREQRDIVTALSALGFRFDGLGGFADGRVPAQRDLSLAVGYAGLDRMRVRSWPREVELEKLFAGATVAADEWLATQADDLALGRMVDALGNRAGELADAWNAWGRIRPLLLATD